MGHRKTGSVVVAWPWHGTEELLAPIRHRFPGVDFAARPFYGRYSFLEPGSADQLDESARAAWAGAEVVLGFDIPADLSSIAPGVRWIQAIGAGVNHLLDYSLPQGLVITNAAGVGAASIAEFVMARLLAVWKSLGELDQAQRDRVWRQVHGRLVLGRVLGIIGLGAIGREIARRGRAFGLEVIGVRRRYRSGDTDPDVDVLAGADQLVDILGRCDAVVCCVPETAETINLFSDKTFAALPKDAIFCNVGRGSSVDEPSLIRALESGHLGAAILDVTRQEPLPPSDPLWEAPNLLLSAHCSVSEDRYAERLFNLFADNLEKYLNDEPLDHVVDLQAQY